MRDEDSSFENEINNLLLESDQSDTEENNDNCLVSGAAARRGRRKQLSELQSSRSKYRYGKNQHLWNNISPSSRVANPQRKTITSRITSLFTDVDQEDFDMD